MADVLPIAELDRRALEKRHDVLARIVIRGHGYHADRISNELRSLNPEAPRLPGLLAKIDETGRWNASFDAGAVSGRGFASLISTLADVSIDRAAAWLAHLPELAEPNV